MKQIFLLICLFIFFAYLPLPANATNYYVAKTGNDSNSCTSARSTSTPKKTIKAGIGCIRAGDTLFIRAGTYAEPLDTNSFTLPVGTSWDNAPRIVAFPDEEVILTRGSSSRILNLQGSVARFLIFEGFIFDAAGGENGIKIMQGAHHIRIQDCEVKNSLGQGILMTGSTETHHNEILRCDVYGHGKDLHFDHGIYIAASDNLVEDCNVYNNLAYGVHVYDGSTAGAHRNIIRRVRSYGNGENGILIGSGTGNIAYNNIVYENGMSGIQVGFQSVGSKVYNNTIYKNGREGVQIRSGSSGTIVKNNIIYANLTTVRNDGSSTILSNNLMTDPLFRSTSTSDFRLKTESLALNKGVTISEVVDDFEKKTRPIGASYDIGAFEEGSSSSLTRPIAPASLQVSP